MSKHKSLVFMLLAIVLLVYAGLLTVYPAMLNLMFNETKFGEKAYKATGLITTVKDVEFKMKPSLTLVITLRNWSSKYIDYQDCFDADFIEIETGALSPITKNFPIKQMNLRHVKFSDQQLPDGENKLAYLRHSFEASAFGAKTIKVAAGPVQVYDFKIKRIGPAYYKEDNRREEQYTKTQVKDFLNMVKLRHVEVR